MTLAKRLEEARKVAGLSQEQLAELSGITQTGIAKIESGKGAMPQSIDALSKVLGVSSAWLLFGEGEPPDERPPTAGLSKDEQEVLAIYRQMDDKDKKLVRRMLKGLSICHE